ncbi:unnamed protein product [Closterium sp. Naga37s-1]|nr:unnamed protein product [Closterium sp. Naga37s-1]
MIALVASQEASPTRKTRGGLLDASRAPGNCGSGGGGAAPLVLRLPSALPPSSILSPAPLSFASRAQGELVEAVLRRSFSSCLFLSHHLPPSPPSSPLPLRRCRAPPHAGGTDGGGAAASSFPHRSLSPPCRYPFDSRVQAELVEAMLRRCLQSPGCSPRQYAHMLLVYVSLRFCRSCCSRRALSQSPIYTPCHVRRDLNAVDAWKARGCARHGPQIVMRS